ncbi:class I SAM-dependent methyltransferase [Jeotgalibaca arthritidis]|uniref:Methyltransferase domain-containing protein n=1 Tax=Jeotgalibaca arthritidis TaxID=1868794 RepID=A0A6G7KCT0_9LACT|nr:class I SAM-dependent methyltransferase [Jeotgalibaca arthritidis]QII83050.1 methyltransferase domain-containing protein [Jeotgalibaca arthritidis]
MLKKALDYSHSLLKECVIAGDLVIDATVGNGHDTILLASLVGPNGSVIGFDIQEQAIQKTSEKLLLTGLSQQVHLHQVGHQFIGDYLPSQKQVSAAIYNLGYLPGGDKSITTLKESTIESIKQLIPHLRIGALVVIVVYSGHPTGQEEKDALLGYLSSLDQKDYAVLQYGFINQKNQPPFVVAIEKKK